MVETDVIKALVRLETDRDWQVFLRELKHRREAARDQLECTDNAWQTGRAQGRAELAGELLDLARSARTTLAKLQAR